MEGDAEEARRLTAALYMQPMVHGDAECENVTARNAAIACSSPMMAGTQMAVDFGTRRFSRSRPSLVTEAHLLGRIGHGQNSIHRGIVLFLVAFQIVPIGHLRAQVPGTAGHEHLTEVACVDVPPGEKRPEFGCFNIGMVTGLHFSQASVYWHLRAFPSRKAAEAAKSATGIVVEEDGRVWLSEFGPRDTAPRGGEAIAIVGPLQLPAATSYTAVLSYAVMRPGDSSRVHTHPGPEGWYVLAGEQCLETPAGANRARAGGP